MTTRSKRIKQLQSLYLEPAKSTLLDQLSDETRIPKAVLLREAVDDLLVKYTVLKAPKGGKGPI